MTSIVPVIRDAIVRDTLIICHSRPLAGMNVMIHQAGGRSANRYLQRKLLESYVWKFGLEFPT